MGTWQIWLNCSCFTIRLNSTGLIMINAGNGRGKKKKKLLLTHWCGCESPCSGGEHVVINSNTIISIIIIIIIFFFTLFFLLVTCLRLLPVVITVLLMALALHKPPLQHSRYFLSLDLIHSCILFSHSLVPPRSVDVTNARSFSQHVPSLFPSPSPLYSLFLLSSPCPFYLFISSLPVVSSHQACYYCQVQSGTVIRPLELAAGPHWQAGAPLTKHYSYYWGCCNVAALAGICRSPQRPGSWWAFAEEKQWEVKRERRHPPGAKGWNRHCMATNGSSEWHTLFLWGCRWCLSTGSVAILERQ